MVIGQRWQSKEEKKKAYEKKLLHCNKFIIDMQVHQLTAETPYKTWRELLKKDFVYNNIYEFERVLVKMTRQIMAEIRNM